MSSANTSDGSEIVRLYCQNGRFKVSFSKDPHGDPVFKVKLSRYFSAKSGTELELLDDLSTEELRRAEEALARYADRKTATLVVDESYEERMSSLEDHIREKRRIGADIKKHVESVSLYIDDFRSVVDSEMIRPLREQQMWDAYFMCVLGKAANFSVPGSGKTASVYGMYCYLKHIGFVSKIIVISPINSFTAWIDEYSNCFGTHPQVFSIQNNGGMSAGDVETFLKYDSGKIELFLFNYESTLSYGDMIHDYIIDGHTLVVLDEVHRIKAVNGSRATATMAAVRDAKYLVPLTGTPIPNSYEDLYNLFNIIFGSNYRDMLGMTPAQMRKPSVMEIEEINNCLYPFYCRTNKRDLGVPAPNPDVIVSIDASESENALFDELMLRLSKLPLALIIRTIQMEADPDMLLHSVDQSMLDSLGVEYQELWGLDITVPHMESSKMRRCIDYVKGLISDGKRVIVWCLFIRSMEGLASRLKEQGISVKKIYGAVPPDDRQRLLQQFKNGEFQVLISNPQTLAESISLHTVCHDAVYFEYGFNLVHLLQSKDRIHRLGLPDGQYTQYHFMEVHFSYMGMDYSLDARIHDRLNFKENVMLKAIDDRHLETMPSDEDDIRAVLGPLFENANS